MIKTNIPIKDIADYTILVLYSRGIPVSPLKLQKILYYIQAWHMVYFGKDKLIFDEAPEAWINGPVYRSIFDAFKNKFGLYDNIIPDIQKDISIEKSIYYTHSKLGIDKDQTDFLESIFLQYGTMTDGKLVFLTHCEKPWSEKREGLEPFDHSEEKISMETMYQYYYSRMERNRKERGNGKV